MFKFNDNPFDPDLWSLDVEISEEEILADLAYPAEPSDLTTAANGVERDR